MCVCVYMCVYVCMCACVHVSECVGCVYVCVCICGQVWDGVTVRSLWKLKVYKKYLTNNEMWRQMIRIQRQQLSYSFTIKLYIPSTHHYRLYLKPRIQCIQSVTKSYVWCLRKSGISPLKINVLEKDTVVVSLVIRFDQILIFKGDMIISETLVHIILLHSELHINQNHNIPSCRGCRSPGS